MRRARRPTPGWTRRWRKMWFSPDVPTSRHRDILNWFIDFAAFDDAPAHDPELKRGQVRASVAEISQMTGIPKSSVHRIIEFFRDDSRTVLGTIPGTNPTVYVVNNFEVYQGEDERAGRSAGQEVGRDPGQSPFYTYLNKNKKKYSDLPSASASAAPTQEETHSSSAKAEEAEGQKTGNERSESQKPKGNTRPPKQLPPPRAAACRPVANALRRSVQRWKADYLHTRDDRWADTERRWLFDIDKAERLDGRSLELQTRVAGWLADRYRPRPDFDWRGNICSAAKFREKFDKLESEMARDQPKRSTFRVGLLP